MLSGIVRRQPVRLDLSWTNISEKQLTWLIHRLQGLKELLLAGCTWSAVSSLCTASFPCLSLLDLGWVQGMKTSHLRELLSPPSTDCKTGCHRLTDQSLAFFKRCPHLQLVDLRSCRLLTSEGFQRLLQDPPSEPNVKPFQCAEEQVLSRET
ncbi:hypothetical protein AB205_0071140, partial [Aquarana catesbeiana]